MTLNLIKTDDGWGHGPWATVEDGATDQGLIPPQKLLVFQLDWDECEWEEYHAPASVVP
jgi:hypothetical protein